MAKWLTLVGLLAVMTIALLAYVKLRSPSTLERAEAIAHGSKRSLEPLFPVPAFGYQDQRGATVTPQSLAGQVWVANFIFTTCRTICPLMTAKMVQLQRRLAGVDARFVSFSVDPSTDTPEVLAAYARRWAAEETRWTLLATDEKTLPLVAAGFHITAEKNKPGELDPIIHSSVFVLVDQRGVVRGIYDSEQRADLRELEQHVRTLLGNPAVEPPAATVADGNELYHSQSCATCHEDAALAPPLFGRAGSRVTFETGIVLPFDAAYVKESLLAPDAKRARGFPLRMPAYDHLRPDELDALIRFVLERPADAPAAPAEVAVALDPVCHMKVRVTPDALRSDLTSPPTYFCSKHCLHRFEASPGAFLRDAGGLP